MLLAIGIDLGTTNCCVAVTEDGVPRVIQNRAGYRTTPSVVTIAPDSSTMIGRRALRRLLTRPDQTIRASKRLLGRRYDSEDVQRARERSGAQIVPGPHGDTRIRAGGQTLPIPAISAMLLTEMRRIAEADLGEPIHKAVVTVPAYFTERQRQAVRDAGTIAGIQVLAIINEPTAAALSFGVRHKKPMTAAVYDLGGGTFDMSIVRTDGDGRVSVLATTGDNFLGGEDFDLRIVQWLIEDFRATHGIDLGDRAIAVQRLRIAAEKARVDLSSVDEATVRLPFIVTGTPDGPIDLVSVLTRDTLEELTRDLVDRTISICQRALVAASLEPSAIDEVLLVGGMTRTPVVRQALRNLFGRDPSQRIHPDEAVALGAALHAAALTGAATQAELDDVTAHPLGIVTTGGHFEVLIPANSRLPACRERIFTTGRDEQKAIKIIVMQGQSTLASGNELLGEFAVSGLPSAPAGGVEVNVAFMIDKEGLFSASATNLATGDEHEIDVIPDAGFDEGEIEHLSAERTMKEDAMAAAEQVEATRQRLDVLLSETGRLIGRARQLPSPSEKVKSTLDKAERLLGLMHRALRGGPTKDMSQEALVLQRTQRTLRAILCGEPSD